MPVSQQRYHMLHGRLRRFSRTIPGVAAGDVRAVHRARVASRRLRELLPVLGLDADVGRKLIRRLRRTTRMLGAVRELDVLQLLIDELHESGRHGPDALNRVARHVAAIRAEAVTELGGRDAADHLARTATKLEALADELKAEKRSPAAAGVKGLRWAVDARIARRASALRTAMNAAGHVYLPERLHAVRIAVKKLRYGVELSGELSSATASQHVALLKRVQTLLGRMHDLQMLAEHVRQVQATLDPPDAAVSRELDMLIIALDRSCRRLHARFVRERPALVSVCERLTARARPARRSLAHDPLGESRVTRITIVRQAG